MTVRHVPAAVVEFAAGRASVILDSKFLSGLTEGSHVLYAAPQEHDAISGSYAPTRPAVAALGKRIDEEPITHGTPSPTEVHPPVLEPITQTWAGKEPSEARKWYPHESAEIALDELRRSCATMIGADPETWPDHGNAPLAIAASLGLADSLASSRSKTIEELRAAIAAEAVRPPVFGGAR